MIDNINRLICIFKSTTPLRVGGDKGKIGDPLDMPLVREANGDLFIPGTSIAGVMRHFMLKIAPRIDTSDGICVETGKSVSAKSSCNCMTCRLMGDVNSDTSAGASKLIINNAYLLQASEVRDMVAINRLDGAAHRAGRAKFNAEIVPVNTEFTCKIEFDRYRQLDDKEKILLYLTLEAFKEGILSIGGGFTRGFGRVRLESYVFETCNLNEKNSLLSYLKNPEKAFSPVNNFFDNIDNQKTHRYSNSNMPEQTFQKLVTLSLEAQAEGFFLTNSSISGIEAGFDHATTKTAGIPVLPGSSVKGAFRSRLEYIGRTIALYSSTNAEDYLSNCPCCHPYGDGEDYSIPSCSHRLAKEQKKTPEEVSADNLCIACRLFGSQIRRGRFVFSDSLIGNPVYKTRDFVAINRSTGGAKDGAKFDAQPLWKPTFEIKIVIENPSDWELGAIALLLNDLKDGLITLGLGENKGFGEMEITEICFKSMELSDELKKGQKPFVEKEIKLDETRCKKDFIRVLKGFKLRPIEKAKDIYFCEGSNLSQIYPRVVQNA